MGRDWLISPRRRRWCADARPGNGLHSTSTQKRGGRGGGIMLGYKARLMPCFTGFTGMSLGFCMAGEPAGMRQHCASRSMFKQMIAFLYKDCIPRGDQVAKASQFSGGSDRAILKHVAFCHSHVPESLSRAVRWICF